MTSQVTAACDTQTSMIRLQTVNDDYTSLMETPARQDDLDNFSFEEFVSFLFEPDVPPASVSEDPWHWNMESEIVARKVCAYYVRLISRASVPVRPVHESQLEEGLWNIAGRADCCVAEIVGDSNLPFVLREEIIRSMADLFRLLFVTEPLDTSVFMCWDALCYDWHCGNRNRETWWRG